MNNLIEHAQRELEMCGQFEEDPRFAQSLVAAVAAFTSYPGHSGSSAMIGAEMLRDLLLFNNLSPLTDNPNEWLLIMTTPDNLWQNVRNGACFSKDGGSTYYSVDERVEGVGVEGLPIHVSKEWADADPS